MRIKRLALSVILLVLTCLATVGLYTVVGFLKSKTTPSYEKGLSVLDTQGLDAGLEYFDKGARSGDLESIFGSGWAHFQKGEFDIATDIAYLCLNDPDSDRAIKAMSHFLLGQIRMIGHGDFNQSIEHFKHSQKYYRWLEFDEGIYQCQLNIATALHYKGENDKAFNLLSSLSPLTADLGKYYLLMGKIQFGRGNRSEASSALEQALNIFTKADDDEGRAKVLSRLGWNELITGSKEEGETLSESAINLVIGNKKLSVYFIVNRLIYLECDSPLYAQSLDAIRERSNDFILEQYVNAAREINQCEVKL